MIYSPPVRRRRARRAWLLLAGAALVVAALAHDWRLSAPLPAASPTPIASPVSVPLHAARGEAAGALPDGTTVFDDVPGVRRLDPALLAALRRAATDAARDGVRVLVDSGWRSRAYQAKLLREAIAKYGSAAEAARWVATPDTSAHVSGEAVDIGPAAAAAWLSAHGAAYGLCRIYGNEPWHFELRPEAVSRGCPSMYPDAASDPRLRR